MAEHTEHCACAADLETVIRNLGRFGRFAIPELWQPFPPERAAQLRQVMARHPRPATTAATVPLVERIPRPRSRTAAQAEGRLFDLLPGYRRRRPVI